MAGVIPFAAMLLGIAVLPLWIPKWWESNRNKGIFTVAISAPALGVIAWLDTHLIQHAAEEYVSFIVLLGSLYYIAGGVVVRGRLRPSPFVNAGMLGFGAILASLIGTTGASMVMIRPFLRANRIRASTRHLPVFFIFVVSNAGGLLTPIGDPPLFLGYLRGVPFTWTLQLWPTWLLVNGTLVGLFLLFELRSLGLSKLDGEESEPVSIAGAWNLLLLAGVVASAALLGAVWRELSMVALTGISATVTRKEWRDENGFTTHPIAEVAVLFAGIFLTMQPALTILQTEGPRLGLTGPQAFFWASGLLSSVLDNAPTYLTFFTVAQAASAGAGDLVAGVRPELLVAISLGSVLMGANTYIGNGPNFMVKSISEESGFSTPSFFGFIAWSALILGPLWLLVAALVL
ncbi:MAG: sodium:proton antiporter [Deltaproteobacteria bacterium]|nr:sodium:proton antiporter [Deltaproteobacteria bacterium]